MCRQYVQKICTSDFSSFLRGFVSYIEQDTRMLDISGDRNVLLLDKNLSRIQNTDTHVAYL